MNPILLDDGRVVTRAFLDFQESLLDAAALRRAWEDPTSRYLAIDELIDLRSGEALASSVPFRRLSTAASAPTALSSAGDGRRRRSGRTQLTRSTKQERSGRMVFL